MQSLSIKKFPLYPALSCIVLVVFFYLMLSGSYSYEWLEDDDPWGYATGAKYVSTELDYHTVPERVNYNHYLFPQSHATLSVMVGLLNQISPEMYDLLKIFINFSLLLGVIGLFLFAYLFSGKNSFFAFCTLLLLVVTPSFAGHFIFNYTLAVVFFLIFLYSFSLILIDFKHIWWSGAILGSVLVTHPVMGIQAAFVLFILLLYYGIRELLEHKFKVDKIFKNYKQSSCIKVFIVGILGILFCLVYYGDLVATNGLDPLLGTGTNNGKGGPIALNYQLDSYDIEDKHLSNFFIAPKNSRMDQQEGIGLVLFSLCLIGLGSIFIIKKPFQKHTMVYVILFAFYFIFLWLLTGGNFNFSLQNYRWWSILAVFVALHGAATIEVIFQLLKKEKVILIIVLVVLALGIFYTSAIPRYTVQRSQWPPGADWTSGEELQGYVQLRELGSNNKIFGLCYSQDKLHGNNQLMPVWSDSLQAYSTYYWNKTNEKSFDRAISLIQAVLAEESFDYLIMDSTCARDYGENISNQILQYLITEEEFAPVQSYSNPGFILLDV